LNFDAASGFSEISLRQIPRGIRTVDREAETPMQAEMGKLKAIFLEAVENYAPEQWGAYLDEACGGDRALRENVEMLLEAHQEGCSLMEKGPLATVDSVGLTAVGAGTGSRIGPYTLREQIGEGGFGLVFVAEQQRPVRRQVALKIIKPGMDSRDVIARFEAERQALALMDHPNIARVLDAGTTESGRPYFVMELVRGIPITDYCDKHHLAPRERLSLFLDVCQAVQHAHQKGIIHRDIKPGNVLVTLHDTRPIVKVIDFGVAKAINQQLTERTIYTKFSQMVGTPLYMSPEQAEMSGLDVDTRTDIYALGVLLYELLTGTTPFDSRRLKEAAFDEVRRIIREEEPPKPSTRISALGDTLDTVAARRKTDPRKLSLLMRGDLDWIAMRALEKDRTRRYQTANGLARDLDRFLADEPVEARAPSTAYQIRKLMKRNRGLFVTGALLLIVVSLAGGVSIWQYVRAANAQRTAALQRLAAQEARREAELANQRLQRNRSLALASTALLLAANRDYENSLVQFERALDMDPNNALAANNFAWVLVTAADRELWDAQRAAELAQHAIDLVPDAGLFWNTLGVAHYRLGNWQQAIESLEKSLELLGREAYGFNAFCLSMSYAQLGRREDARSCYDAGMAWMKENNPGDAELAQFCKEAESLLRDSEKSKEISQEEADDGNCSTGKAVPPGSGDPVASANDRLAMMLPLIKALTNDTVFLSTTGMDVRYTGHPT
jgi:serine/threonine protein kinase/Tfp pilus assembly protein PilF